MTQEQTKPVLDPKHDAELVAGFKAIREGTVTSLGANVDALEDAIAAKINTPETGLRPRIWDFERREKAAVAALEDQEIRLQAVEVKAGIKTK